jgi:putative endonuclease
MFKPKHQYAVSITTNKKNGTLYIDMINNLKNRVFEHKNKLIDGFTKKYELGILVYFEICK